MLIGELVEIGAVKDGQEVQAAWTSSKPAWFEVVDGAIICLHGSATTEIVADITATYNGEAATCKVKGWANSAADGTRFKIVEFNLGPSVISKLEFVKNGVVQDFSTLTILNGDPTLLDINMQTGSFTPLKEGKGYVVCIFEGKKYAAIVKSSLNAVAEQQSEEPEKTKTTKRTKK